MIIVDVILILAYNYQPGVEVFKLSISAMVGFQIVSGIAAALSFHPDSQPKRDEPERLRHRPPSSYRQRK
jgi:hypothetical protein